MTDDKKAGDTKIKLTEAKKTPRILIGVPILAWTHEFALSFLSFWTELMTYEHKGRSFQVCYNFKYRRPIHLAEAELAQDALDSDCTHLLLMDDDIYDVTVKNLLSLIDADKDVVGGIMFTSKFPHALCAFRRYNDDKAVAEQPNLKDTLRLYEVPPDQRKGVQPVDLIPFGFTLIKTDVFRKLKKPWFTCDSAAPTDSWFADAVLNAKMQYYAHFDVWLNHNGVTKENQAIYMQMGMAKQANQKRAINITPEEMARHEAMMRIKMVDAEAKFKKSRITDVQIFEKKEGDGIATRLPALKDEESKNGGTTESSGIEAKSSR